MATEAKEYWMIVMHIIKNHFISKYDFAITEIQKSNHRSTRAHERIGFETVHSYKDCKGYEWNIIYGIGKRSYKIYSL